MYFVDRHKMGHILNYFDRLLEVFESGHWNDNEIRRLCLERLTQNLIESLIDVGNQMIDGFIMRDPGGYEDIIAILQDESVIPSQEAEQLGRVVGLRKVLVQQYTDVDHGKLTHVVAENLPALKHFSKRISDYLDQELGPVSAFSAENTEKGNC